MMNLYGQYFSANCGLFPFPVMRLCLFHPLTLPPLPPGDVNICKHINMLKLGTHFFLKLAPRDMANQLEVETSSGSYFYHLAGETLHFDPKKPSNDPVPPVVRRWSSHFVLPSLISRAPRDNKFSRDSASEDVQKLST